MRRAAGRLSEIRLDAGGHTEAYITCPAELVPEAGQYVHASDSNNSEEVLGTPLFLAGKSQGGFWAASSIPITWRLGTQLSLVGPLGNGFSLPPDSQRLALVALGDTLGRLMPLVWQENSLHRSMTLFTDLPLPSLPSWLEVYPLASLREALDWPDFMVIDLPLARLPSLRTAFGLPGESRPPFPGQVLIVSPMPCAGLARCGACEVPTVIGGRSVTCEWGPVITLDELKW